MPKGDIVRSVTRAQERTARERFVGKSVPVTAQYQPGVENVTEALAGQPKQSSVAQTAAPSKPVVAQAEETPSPAQRVRQKVDPNRSENFAKGDIRGFIRPGAGTSFVRKSARLGAFDPRQRSQGEKRRASDALTPISVAVPTAIQTPGLPPGVNLKQYEEDQKLLGAVS